MTLLQTPEGLVYANVTPKKASDTVKAKDSFFYKIGCIITFGTAFMIGWSSSKFYFYWMIFVQMSLYIYRYIDYRQKNWHYFFLEFCNFIMLLLFILILAFPASETLYYGCYAAGTGVLANAIMSMRNSTAFHDMDKMCSTAIHFFPQLTMWNIHWNLRGTTERAEWGFMEVGNIEFSWDTISIYFKSFYLIYFGWAIVYYILVIGIIMPIIEKNNGLCMVNYEFETGPIMKKVYKKYGKNISYVAYMLQHLIYASIFAVQTLPGFYLRYYSTAQMIFYLVLIFFNGSSFYCNYFPRYYQKMIAELDKQELNIQKADK